MLSVGDTCYRGHLMSEENSVVSGGRLRCRACTREKSRSFAARNPLYNCWSNMIKRCTHPSDRRWADYGGRGIFVCIRWLKSYRLFVADIIARIGERPPGMSLDRRDNNSGYYPDTVKWATVTEQSRNRRINRLITIGRETLCLSQWSERSGIDRNTIDRRIARGVKPRAAVTKSVSRAEYLLTIDGETHCLTEWARKFDTPRSTVHARLGRGMDPKTALAAPPMPRSEICALAARKKKNDAAARKLDRETVAVLQPCG
jgi:hypothetical protein